METVKVTDGEVVLFLAEGGKGGEERAEVGPDRRGLIWRERGWARQIELERALNAKLHLLISEITKAPQG